MKFILHFLCVYIMESIATSGKEDVHIDDDETTTMTTTTQFSSTSYEYAERHPFELNLKVIGILIGCIILLFGIIRLCLMLYNSSRLSNRRTTVVRPQVATVELNQFKPDIPPAYAEAVANIDIDDSKLPSYNELRHSTT